MNNAALNIGEAIERVHDIDGFDAWLDQHQMTWQQLSRGEYDGLTIEMAQLAYVSQDPVLWCKAFLREPNPTEQMVADRGDANGDVPYEFWDYQEESIYSWPQDVIHQDAAEVGKTREITSLVLWGQCTAFGGSISRPYILVGAPQQTHLDEIIMDIEEHVGVADDHNGDMPFINHFWRKPKRTPHTMMRFATPNSRNPTRPYIGRVYFRPAGHDGEAFRGVHVNALGLFDEAAKIKNKTIFSEFFRALKPGCPNRLYSVPDGDRASEFYRMGQEAIPDLGMGKPGRRLFHWAKALMPPPFWTPERKQHFISLYGGENSPGYQRNVLGLSGQQENTVWSYADIEPNLRDVPEYRCIRLVVDTSANSLHVQANAIEYELNAGKKIGKAIHLEDRFDSLDSYPEKHREQLQTAFYDLLREFIDPPAGQSVLWWGNDLGYKKDPTEIFLYRELGAEMRHVLRVHVEGMSYDLQCELIFALDRVYNHQGAWGVDLGNAGTMVVASLQNREEYEAADFENRMTGFEFGRAVEAVDEEGNVAEEEDRKTGEKKPVRLPAKQLATELITKRQQSHGYAEPVDDEVINHMTNHTAKQGARNLIYSKENDHTIDAKRTAMLRKVFNEDNSPDVFSSGAHARSA